MYSLVNNVNCEVVAELKSTTELIEKVQKIAIENEDFNFSFLGISDVLEYIEEYCENLNLLVDSEVEEFLTNYGIEVEDNEPNHYVELMMDNHKCIEFKGKQYYISDSLDLTDDEKNIYEILVYYLHV